MKIGYFEHWSRPHWQFVDFLREEGYDIEKIDYSRKNYLEKYDVVLVEQHGFNDYIENDEIYIQDWVSRGGFFLFLHQDYQRWAPCFLPEHLQGTNLIHRYIPTIGTGNMNTINETYMCYMMPWPEGEGKRLFNYPEKIELDEMLGWHIKVNSFTVLRGSTGGDISEFVRTSALNCFLADDQWEVLGSFMDPGVRNGALILQGRHGKGLYFLNQILVPEVMNDETGRCLAFWRKYMRNLMQYFQDYRDGVTREVPAPASLPAGRTNYKLCVHMHSLDWYGCDSAPGTINALMKQMNYDICALALKDAAPYKGKLDPKKYSDEKVLFLNGQEYHPFNWGDKINAYSHNGYHLLAVGTDYEAYTPKFTRSLYGDAEVDAYLKEAIQYIHDHNGAAIATHPDSRVPKDADGYGYWLDYPVDAADMEPLATMAGSAFEKCWLKGRKVAVMNSVDLFGTRRIYDNPAVNFIYLADGEQPGRDSVVKAIRLGHTIATCGFDEAHITCNGAIPGSVVDASGEFTININAAIWDENIREVRIYADDQVILADSMDEKRLDREYKISAAKARHYIRVEVSGVSPLRIAVSTPFYLK